MVNPSKGQAKKISAFRILAPFLGGLAILAFLGFEAWYRMKHTQSGMMGFIAEGLTRKPVVDFGVAYGLKLLLPFYMVAGLLLWLVTLAWGSLWRREWRHHWTFREAFGFSLAALGWSHLVLWWQVPSTLWVLPGLRALPFYLIFPLLTTLVLCYPIVWMRRQISGGGLRFISILGGWLLIWSIPPIAPQVLPRMLVVAKGGDDACQMLILGIDGLRSDTFLENTQGWQGLRYKTNCTFAVRSFQAAAMSCPEGRTCTPESMN